ncbi:MAG: sodium/proline symporter [Lentisphaeria bacterium]|nr:sodium/proline symporter [Lentisphaeria bacterium]
MEETLVSASMRIEEIVIFVIYLLCMLAIGIYFFFKDRNGGEKTYFLGDRQMRPWVAALSAGASDMSAWVLMGLPTAIYLKGMGQVWIPVGLAIGYALSWIFLAPRLRKFSVVYGDAITIPQFLTNRFLAKSKSLQVICAIVFLIAYTIYTASSVKACGTLFNTVTGLDPIYAMYLAAIVIVSYTFLGGFSAVCWTDFFQGLLILGAMLLAPVFAAFTLQTLPSNPGLESGLWDNAWAWKDIASGLGWGLGYFGMPHIIIRFMSLKSQKNIRKSSVIGISWTVLVVIFAALIGIIGRKSIAYTPEIAAGELVFIEMVRQVFPALLCGVLLSAVLAASMSTADSQLLAASSAFSSDVYKPIIRKGQSSDAELLWVGRFIVLIVALLALLIATNPSCGSIMGLVSNAWGVFGAAFGPTILLCLFWKRFNFLGAIAGILVGAVVDIAWFTCMPALGAQCEFIQKCFVGVYEIIPGFIVSLIAAILITKLTAKPADDVTEKFTQAVTYED